MLFEVIELAKPLHNDAQCAAEQFVETEMVPKFHGGMPTDIILDYEDGVRSDAVEDTWMHSTQPVWISVRKLASWIACQMQCV